MDAVWATGQAVTVSGLMDVLARRKKPLAYSTIKTILTNLADKGYLVKRAAGRANSFAAAQSKLETQEETYARADSSARRRARRVRSKCRLPD